MHQYQEDPCFALFSFHKKYLYSFVLIGEFLELVGSNIDGGGKMKVWFAPSGRGCLVSYVASLCCSLMCCPSRVTLALP